MQKYYYLLIVCYSIAAINLASCTKQDEASGMFNGTNSITGTVLFTNEIAESQDTASNATVKLTDIDNGEEYTITATGGKFTIPLLKDGNYKLLYNFTQLLDAPNTRLEYTGETTLQLAGDTTLMPVLAWGKNTSVLELIITDSTTAHLPAPNVSICLYSNYFFMAADTGTCAGSVRAAVTDSRGRVFFSGLQHQLYYVKARTVIGNTVFTNSATDTSVFVNQNTITSDTIPIH